MDFSLSVSLSLSWSFPLEAPLLDGVVAHFGHCKRPCAQCSCSEHDTAFHKVVWWILNRSLSTQHISYDIQIQVNTSSPIHRYISTVFAVCFIIHVGKYCQFLTWITFIACMSFTLSLSFCLWFTFENPMERFGTFWGVSHHMFTAWCTVEFDCGYTISNWQ